MSVQPEKPGLQAERTQLAWERRALVFLVRGAIPLLREEGPLAGGRSALAISAVLLAALVVWFGILRGRRTLEVHPVGGHKIIASPRNQVLVLGWATAGFATMIVVLLML